MPFSSEFSPSKDISEFSYCGWIPCIAGHLDFCLMSVGLSGNHFPDQKSTFIEKRKEWLYQRYIQDDKQREGEADPKKYTFNFAWDKRELGHARRVVLQSWVNWKDQLPGNGHFRVVVVAEANKEDNLDLRRLEGYVIIYPRSYSYLPNNPTAEDKIKFAAHSSVMDIIGEMNKVDKIDQLGRRLRTVSDSMNKLWSDLYNVVKRDNPLGDSELLTGVFSIKFRVEPNGLTYLSYRPSKCNSYDSIKPDNQKYIICRQAFYYLKYALHRHAYHDKECDSLTTTIQIDHANLEFVGIQLIGQLKRELIRQKREDAEPSDVFLAKLSKPRTSPHTDCLGIIGYAKSLITSCSSSGLLSKESSEKENKYFDSMALAFKAHQDRTSLRDVAIDRKSQFGRQWTAITLASISIMMFAFRNFFGSGSNYTATAPEPSKYADWGTWQLFGISVLIFFAVFLTYKGLIWVNEIYCHPRLSHMIKMGKPRIMQDIRIVLYVVLFAYAIVRLFLHYAGM